MTPTRGILLKLLSVTAFVAMQALIKSTEGRVPTGEVMFLRSLFALPVILGWLALRRELIEGFRTAKPMSHVWRGLAGTSAMGFGFAALQLLPLPEVTAIGYAAPLLVVIFAAMFLGEEVRAFRITAVALGMAGVIIVLAPQLSGMTGDDAGTTRALGAILMLISAICAALAQTFVRKMVATERAATVALYFTLTSLGISTLTLPFSFALPSSHDAIALVLAGLLGGLGQSLLTSAYRFADASVVAPFEYASMLLAIGIGFFIFGEIPTLMTLAGAALIVAAGILIIWREGKLGLERSKARKAMTLQG
ncbi:MAG: DMT family transporter [Maritimibacter sp.]|jgi:drug/metabolite transporter (DMT)-like permease